MASQLQALAFTGEGRYHEQFTLLSHCTVLTSLSITLFASTECATTILLLFAQVAAPTLRTFTITNTEHTSSFPLFEAVSVALSEPTVARLERLELPMVRQKELLSASGMALLEICGKRGIAVRFRC